MSRHEESPRRSPTGVATAIANGIAHGSRKGDRPRESHVRTDELTKNLTTTEIELLWHDVRENDDEMGGLDAVTNRLGCRLPSRIRPLRTIRTESETP